MSVEFKLFGEMTVRQFMYVGGSGLLSFIISQIPIPGIISWPIIVVLLLLGLFTAFIPINEVPFDEWMTNYIIAVLRPTKRIWKQSKFTQQFLKDQDLISSFKSGSLTNSVNLDKTGKGIPLIVTDLGDKVIDQLEKSKLEAIEIAKNVVEEKWNQVSTVIQKDELQLSLTAPVKANEVETPDIAKVEDSVAANTISPAINLVEPTKQTESIPLVAEPEKEIKIEGEKNTVKPIASEVINSLSDIQGMDLTQSILGQGDVSSSQKSMDTSANLSNKKEEAITSQMNEEDNPTVINVGSAVLHVKESFQPQTAPVPMSLNISSEPSQTNASGQSQGGNIFTDKVEVVSQNVIIGEQAEVSLDKESKSKDLTAEIEEKLKAQEENKADLESLISKEHSKVNGGESGQEPNLELLQMLETLKEQNIQLTTQLTKLKEQMQMENIDVPVNEEEQLHKYAPFPDFVKNANIIAGIVIDKDEKVISDVVIIVKDEMFKPVRAVHTNVLGQFFTRSPLPNGKYKIELHKENLLFKRIEIKIDGNPVKQLLIKAVSKDDMLTLTQGVPFNVFNSISVPNYGNAK